MSQGNCSTGGHRGEFRHSYDFGMPMGTAITASRGGRVTFARDHFSDQTTGMAEANLVLVLHLDDTVAEYGHLRQDGALVDVGDVVEPGDPIGFSGNSGFTGGFPHLHFHVRSCPECDTIPVTFRNTEPNEQGLQAGRVYAANLY